jgi:hypothetical protein
LASKARNKNQLKWFCVRTSIEFLKNLANVELEMALTNDGKKYNKITINISLKVLIETDHKLVSDISESQYI